MICAYPFQIFTYTMTSNIVRACMVLIVLLGVCAVYFRAVFYSWNSYVLVSSSNEKLILRQKKRNFSVLESWDHKNDWPRWTYNYSLQPWLDQNEVSTAESNKLERRLPQVIGIGTKKCGTRALQYFLSAHPKFKTIEISGKAEAHFFDSAKYQKGLGYYRSMMPLSLPDDVVFEKSPRYFFSARVPSRIVEWKKDVKIILVVCDPVLRAFSDYTFIRNTAPPYRRNTMPNFTSFDDYLDSAMGDLNEIKDGAYRALGFGTYHSFVRNAWNERTFHLTALTNGMYAIHLEDWYNHFSWRHIQVVDGDLLISNPVSVLEEIQKFIGLGVMITGDNFEFNKTKGFYCLRNTPCLGGKKGVTRGANGHQPSISAVKKLKEFYNTYNEIFFALVKKRYNWR